MTQATQTTLDRPVWVDLGAKDAGASPIIHHPDVRRMLLTMRALTGAARSICYATAVAIDRSERATNESMTSSAATSTMTPRTL